MVHRSDAGMIARICRVPVDTFVDEAMVAGLQYLFDLFGLDEQTTHPGIEALLMCDTSALFIATDADLDTLSWHAEDPGNRLIATQYWGMATAMDCGSSLSQHLAKLNHIAVRPEYQNQGIGEQLVLEALDWLAGRGVSRVDLNARSAREAANRLYLRLGFRIHPTNVFHLYL